MPMRWARPRNSRPGNTWTTTRCTRGSGTRAEGSVECVLVQELTEHAKDELRRLGFRREVEAEVEDARFSLPPAWPRLRRGPIHPGT
ncbi:MAG: hypothetical protein ACRDQ5_13570 [Sciscionella sp.]